MKVLLMSMATNITQWIHVIDKVASMAMRNTQWIHVKVDHSHEGIHSGAMSQNQNRGYLEPMERTN
jgi:hypothetical protein